MRNMKSNIYAIGLSIGTILAMGGIILMRNLNEASTNEATNAASEYHVHAAFKVYENGALIDFTGDKYMHTRPCTIEADSSKPKTQTSEEKQEDRGHLHDRVGDVVHVHRDDGRWEDLFTNIKYEMPEKMKAYANGKIVEGKLNKEIIKDERVLFFEEDLTQEELEEIYKQVPSVDRIREVEKKSESCGGA